MAQRIERILWTRQSFPLAMFVKKYKDNFSQLVIVQQEYCGEVDMETFSSGQILKIQGLLQQERVIATDSRKNDLSIPVSYPVEVEVLDHMGKASKPAKLSDILKSHNLPLNVQFVQDGIRKFYSGKSVRNGEYFGIVKLKRVYTENYLTGNYINAGVVDGRVVIIPMYVDIKVGVAIGFGESRTAEWQTFSRILEEAVSELDFHDITGYTEITLYNAGSSDDYGMIKPRQIVRMSVNDQPWEDHRNYSKIDLEERLPPEPPPPRPPKKTEPVKKLNEVTNIVWSETHYEFKNFYEKFCDNLPQFIIVTAGIYGQTELDTVGMEQVIWIQTYSRQRRVIARNIDGRYLSIPISFGVKMHIMGSREKNPQPKTLREIVDTSVLPVKVCFVQSESSFAYTGREKSDTYNMGILELEDIYNETYFLGNGVHKGVLDERVMVVPVYLSIEVAIAETFKPDIQLDWDSFVESLNTKASSVNYDIPTPNQSIAMYSPDQVRVGDNTYEYIVPQNYVAYTGKDEPELSGGDYSEPKEWDHFVPNFSTTGAGESSYTTISVNATKATKATPKTRKGGVRVLPVEMADMKAPGAPPVVKPKPQIKKQTSRDETSEHHPGRSADVGRKAVVSPFHHEPLRQNQAGGNPPISGRPEIGRGTIARRQNLSTKDNQHGSSISLGMSSGKFATLSLIPEDISELTVEDICQCLELLQLHKYKEAFYNLQVDGSLLQSFDAKIFQEDENFKMSVVEAVKLDRFVKGWRPRVQTKSD